MNPHYFVPLSLLFLLLTWAIDLRSGEPGDNKEELEYQKFDQLLPKDGKWELARLGLKYWEKSFPCSSSRIQEITMKNKDTAKLFIFETRPLTNPAEDFSIVFLVVKDQVVDWKSCKTNSRMALQKIVLEDITGNGVAELGFQNLPGGWGKLDKRQHSLPGKKKTWLYAYSITPKGFQSIFPE